MLQAVDLFRLEAVQIAVEFVNGCILLIKLLEFVRTDFSFHPIQKIGPAVRMETADQLPGIFHAARGTGQVIAVFIHLHHPFKNMTAVFTFKLVDRHGQILMIKVIFER